MIILGFLLVDFNIYENKQEISLDFLKNLENFGYFVSEKADNKENLNNP